MQLSNWNHPKDTKANSTGGWIEKHCSSVAGQTNTFTSKTGASSICVSLFQYCWPRIGHWHRNGDNCRHFIKNWAIRSTNRRPTLFSNPNKWRRYFRICFKDTMLLLTRFSRKTLIPAPLASKNHWKWVLANGMWARVPALWAIKHPLILSFLIHTHIHTYPSWSEILGDSGLKVL